MGSTKTEKESNTSSGSVISVVWQSSGKKNTWKCDSQEFLKESLSTILCFIIQGKVSSGKGLNLKFILLRTW